MMDIETEYASGPYMFGKGTLLATSTLFHRILKDRRWDQLLFELAGPESVNGRCVDESLHIFEADSQPHWTGKERDRITSFWEFFGEGRPYFNNLKSRYIDTIFATEKHRWRMASGAPMIVRPLGFLVRVKSFQAMERKQSSEVIG